MVRCGSTGCKEKCFIHGYTALCHVGLVEGRNSVPGIRTSDLSMSTNDPSALPTELPFYYHRCQILHSLGVAKMAIEAKA